MNKFEKFLDSQTLQEVSGENGYIITFGELIDNNGRNEFFRTVRKSKNGFTTSRNVYHGIAYCRYGKVWEAQNYFDISDCKELSRNSKIFVGFTF